MVLAVSHTSAFLSDAVPICKRPQVVSHSLSLFKIYKESANLYRTASGVLTALYGWCFLNSNNSPSRKMSTVTADKKAAETVAHFQRVMITDD